MHDPQHPHSGPALVRATALPQRSGRAGASRTSMAKLARALLESMPDDQRRQAQWPFDEAERRNWHYIPRERAGVPIREMSAASRRALDDLMRHALSEAGYDKATGIFRIEEILGLIQNRPQYRDPENYSVTVFGEPPRLPWGWRIEGHHLSLNFAAASEELFGTTPAFWGAHPATVPESYPMAGHRVLGRETDLAYALIRGLDDAARARAIIADSSLGNIVTGPGRETLLGEREGLALREMPEPLRDLTLELLATYAHNLRHELAEAELQRVREAGVDDLYFAWGGPLEAGEAHYWRLHGPITLIEFDNTQNEANHIHSVWHDLTRNFGRDLLKEHYEHGHAHG